MAGAIAEPSWIQSYDRLGDFLIVCPKIGTLPESVTLEVTEIGAGGARVNVFDFPFRP